MPHINDTAATILANAAARPDLNVFPLPETLKVNAATANKVLNKLVQSGLLAGVGATRDDLAWAEDEEGGRTTLVVTPSGLRAINIEPEEAAAQPIAGNTTMPAAMHKPAAKTKTAKKAPSRPKSVKKAPAGAHKRPTSAKSDTAGVKAAKKAASPRTAAKGLTKQQIVVGMLRRANGASIEELAKATDWQPHSVRGVLTATVKKRLNLPLISEKGEDGVRRYYVAPLRSSKDKA